MEKLGKLKHFAAGSLGKTNRKIYIAAVDWSLICLLLLALFFLCGVGVGQLCAHHVSASIGTELKNYLAKYLQRDSLELSALLNIGSTVMMYFRYPALAFLAGFSPAGVILLPVLTGVFGFGLSFSANCFTATFGGQGLLLAIASEGIRSVITLPCYFILAVPAWRESLALARATFGSLRRSGESVPTRISSSSENTSLRLLGVAVILGLGVCLELSCGVRFLKLALDGFLF